MENEDESEGDNGRVKKIERIYLMKSKKEVFSELSSAKWSWLQNEGEIREIRELLGMY